MKFALLLLTTIASAQVTITISAADKELNKSYLASTRRSVAIWQVTVCNMTAAPVHRSGLRVLQIATTQKLFLYTAQEAIAVMTSEQKRSRSQIAADTGEGLSLLGSGLVAANVIAATSPWITAGILAAGGAHYLSGKLAGRDPDFAKLQGLHLPDDIAMDSGQCWSGDVLGRKPKKKQADLVFGF